MKTLVLDYLEATAARLPDKIAISDPQEAVSFCQLVAQARACACALLPYTHARQTIGFYMDKSAGAFCGFMGAVYAGCAYSPLNLRHPAARIRAILDTISAPVVVTDAENKDALLATGYEGVVLLLEDIRKTAITPEAEAQLARIRRGMIDLDPLYVNFTSGSTGTPKGVVVGHRSVIDFITCFTEIFGITEKDILANQAPFDFDVSVKDLYSGMLTGAQVVIVPTAYFTQPTVLMDYLCDTGATVMVWAVSALCFLTTMNALAYRCPTALRAIIFSGEVMPIKHLHKLQKYLPDVMYVNVYGPTEITCNCTYYIVNRPFELTETLPIGVPFPNERIIVLDENNREVTEIGGVGELCVAGTALALGYFGDEARTAAAFTPNPLNHTHMETIYHTGDLVRILPENEGGMVYVSRKDFQIKHMGHRIELGEIDAAMTALSGVDRACCIYLHDKNKILCVHTGEADKSQLIPALGETLPSYMIPNIFMHIPQMPLNKNGKIDRQALEAQYRESKARR